jgi:phage terminase large subunit-like protein
MISESTDLDLLYSLIGKNRITAEDKAKTRASKTRVAKYRHDLTGFAKYYFPHYVSLEPAPWHKTLFKIFEQPKQNERGKYYFVVTQEVADDLAALHRKEFRNLPAACPHLTGISLAAPREQGKSSVLARIVPIYLLVYEYVQFPVWIRSNGELAKKFLADTMDEFRTNARLIEDFGDLAGEVWRDGTYSLKNGAGCVALGSGASLRGLLDHEKRPDLIYLDDLITDDEKDSIRLMKKTYDWIKSAVLGLSADALVVMLNTIFNISDPMSRYLERVEKREIDNWLGVRLSARIDEHTALWPELWPLEKIAKREALIGDDRIFLPEYMSIVPSSEDSILREEDFIFIDNRTISIEEYDLHVGIDPNAEGSDDASIFLVGKHRETGKFHTFDAWDKDWATVGDLADVIINWYETYKPEMYAMEDNAFQAVYRKLLQEIFLAQGYAIPLVGIAAKGSKAQRFRAAAYQVQAGNMTFTERLRDSSIIYRMIHFPSKGIPDGVVDAFAHGFNSFNNGKGSPVGRAGRRRPSALPGLIGRYLENGY